MKIEDVIDQIYLINMGNRPDKLESSKMMFEKLGITSFKRIVPNFEAFNVDSYLCKERQSVKDSHTRCVLDAIENDYTNILIFEDDFVFNQEDKEVEENIGQHIEACMSFIKKNSFDILYLDNMKTIHKDKDNVLIKIERRRHEENFVLIKGKAYVHSYILNKRIFQAFVDGQTKYKSTGNDGVISHLKGIKYMYSKGIFDQKLGIKADNKWS